MWVEMLRIVVSYLALQRSAEHIEHMKTNRTAVVSAYVVHYGPSHPHFGQYAATVPTKRVAIREARRMARAYADASVVTLDGVTMYSVQRKSSWEVQS
jgi:hypothetical protein